VGHKGFSALTALFLVLAWFSWKEDRFNGNLQTASTTSIAGANTPSTTAVTRAITNEHNNIAQTLRIVTEKWKKTDVNGDGLYNCIDAAVLFYKYYPDKNRVCIEVNVNPKTGMNHLFNCVFTDGVWKAIEPQAYANNYSNYLMWAVWGSQYDKSYNRDETDKWKVYAR
jgi:hypothetical protein